MKRWRVLLGCACICLIWSVGAWAQLEDVQSPSASIGEPLVLEQGGDDEDEGALELDVSGTVSFGLRYGFGDGRGLLSRSYSEGFQFNQLLALNLQGDLPVTLPILEIPGIFSINAQLNSQQADNLQALAMHFESERLTLDFGDFFVGENAPILIVPDRKLKGFKGQWRGDDVTVTGAFARVEGLAESQTFQGNTSRDTVLFSDKQPERNWLDQVYLRNLNGLQYFELTQGFVDGFSKVELNLHPGGDLDDLLISYGLDYLLPAIEADGPQELDESQFRILRSQGETFLILMRQSHDILRFWLRDAIDEFNIDEQLLDDERKTYPFNEDTDFELGFLNQLQAIVTLDVDDARLSLNDTRNQRFFFLGRKDIDEDSLLVEVKSGDVFVNIDDPQFLEFETVLFAEQGLVDFNFPQAFFDNKENQIRATFNYTSTSGIYILGLSIVKGSDRVFLNGAALERDMDYTIDYETGALILFRQVAKEDVLRIEYEVLRGGLGGFAEYQRNLSQLSFEMQPLEWLSLNVDVFQGADIDSGEDRSRLRTMPNTHTTAGITALADLGPFQARALLGYNVNAYPLNDNLRQNLPNQINDIAALEHGGRTYILFGHQNGLTVYREGRWTSYNTASGLSGRSVSNIAVHESWIALATESGVTLVALEGDDPFALITNWLRFYQQDGPADNRVLSVDFEGDWLWLGTGNGLTRVNVDPNQRAFEDLDQWVSFLPERIEAMWETPITHLVADDGLVYLGSALGVQVFDVTSNRFEIDPALRGGEVHDMMMDDDAVYVASQWGLRMMFDGRGGGWLHNGDAVYAVSASGDDVWYALESGLRSEGDISVPSELRDNVVRSLALIDNVVWVGTMAGEPPRYPLLLSRVTASDVESFDDFQTRINGRDLGRYGDIPLDEHLDLGGIGEVSVTYNVGDLSLVAAFEALSDQFSAVGSTPSEGHVRWRVGGDYELGSLLDVSVQHVAGVGDPITTDTIRLSWKEGLDLDAVYSLELDTRRDDLESNFSLTFREGFLNDALDVRVRFDDRGTKSLDRDRRSEEITLATDVEYQLGNALTLEAGVQSPLSFRTGVEDVRGSFKFDGGVMWLPQLDFGTLSLNYEIDGALRFPRGGFTQDHSFDAQLTWQPFQLEGMTLVPRNSITVEQQDRGGTDRFFNLISNNSINIRMDDISGQVRYARDQVNSNLNQTESIQNTFFARADYSGFDDVRPGVSWTLTMVELKHATRDTRITINQQINANADWTPSDTINVNFSASSDSVDSIQERSVNWSGRAAATYAFNDVLDFSANANGFWHRGLRNPDLQNEDEFGNLSFDSTVAANWKFATDWNANFSFGVLWGNDVKDPSNDYLSYIASIQASLTF